MKKNILFLFTAILLAFLLIFMTLRFSKEIDAFVFDPYIPEDSVFNGLTTQEIEDLEREKEFAMELDKHIESQYQEREMQEVEVQPSRSKQNRVITVEATAYTHTGNNTATGVYPRVNHTIAVDPNVIPLGSKVKINGSIYKAEDTGLRNDELSHTGYYKHMRGKRVDIFMDTRKEAINFGRRQIEVEVIREGY